MADDDNRPKDTIELVTWLVDLSQNRMRQDTRLVLCQIDHEWALAESGPANRFSGVTSVPVNEDAGRKLSGYWNRNGYGRFTGGKTPGEVLDILELIYSEATALREGRLAELDAAAEALARGQRNQKRATIRQMATSLLMTVASLSGELGLDDYNLTGVQALARVADE